MPFFWESSYRPYQTGTIDAPLRIRSAGHYRVPRGWSDTPVTKDFLELFWCVEGSGSLQVDATPRRIKKHEACFYLPGDCHRISATDEVFDYCWMALDGPAVDAVIATFRLGREVVTAGRCPKQLFQRLAHEVAEIGREREYAAGMLAYEILSRLKIGPQESGNQVFENFKLLVEEYYNDPDFNIETATALLRIHRSTLSRQTVKACGMPPQEYLCSYRIQIALQMLRERHTSIKEIAEAAGFRDQNYFGKVFTRRLGKPPGILRRELLG